MSAGNFFSAAFENNCLAVAGASGGIFGMIGLYVADMILNFESIKRCSPHHPIFINLVPHVSRTFVSCTQGKCFGAVG